MYNNYYKKKAKLTDNSTCDSYWWSCWQNEDFHSDKCKGYYVIFIFISYIFIFWEWGYKKRSPMTTWKFYSQSVFHAWNTTFSRRPLNFQVHLNNCQHDLYRRQRLWKQHKKLSNGWINKQTNYTRWHLTSISSTVSPRLSFAVAWDGWTPGPSQSASTSCTWPVYAATIPEREYTAVACNRTLLTLSCEKKGKQYNRGL